MLLLLPLLLSLLLLLLRPTGDCALPAALPPAGDLSSTVSALCLTAPRTARGSGLRSLGSGSDYKSRGPGGAQRVVLGPGVPRTSCDVQLVDDSEYELSEEFQLVLSDPSENGRLGDVTVAKVVIDGPNDASTVTLGNATFTFSEDIGRNASTPTWFGLVLV